MRWTLAIAMLALSPDETPQSVTQATNKDMKISDAFTCAVSFEDGPWDFQTIRQFQELRHRIYRVTASAIGQKVVERFFIFGRDSTTTIFFLNADECHRAAKKLDSKKIFPKPGRLLSKEEARALAKTLFHEE